METNYDLSQHAHIFACTGSSYTTGLTSVYSWPSDYLKPSPPDTRFRTSSVRDEPEGGDEAASSGELKRNLLLLHTSQLSQTPGPSFHSSACSSYNYYRGSGSPTYPASQPELTSHPHPGLTLDQLRASNPHAIPPELSALQEQHQIGLPIAVVLCRDSALWTFDLPAKYGCVFLGYFKISRMEYSQKDTDGVQCRMRLEWTPGGDSQDPTVEAPSTPWWVEPPSGDADAEMAMHPYTFLPLHILALSAYTDRDRAIGVSEVTSAEGWQCQNCGKLNVQRNLRFQRCSDCEVSAPNPA